MDCSAASAGGSYVLSGAKIVAPDGIVEGRSVVVRSGTVDALVLDREAPGDLPRIDAGGDWVTPTLVEQHIHGAFGVGFDSLGEDPARSGEALRTLAARLLSVGVGTFMPTMICEIRSIQALAAAIDASGLDETVIPGIYVEGPFISAHRRGGIPAATIRPFEPATLRSVLEAGGGRIRAMTAAPEIDGAEELYRELRNAGVLVFLGHSDCDLEATPLPAVPFGITHLFNAMSPFSHKRAGLAALPFVDRRPWTELNADGVHVNRTALAACGGALPAERLVLISDAAPPAGLPYGDFRYYGAPIRSGPDGVRYTEDGTLMGSNRLAPDVLRHWMEVSGWPAHLAVRTLTANPAELLGLDGRVGTIAPGRMARFAFWSPDWSSIRGVIAPA